MSGTTLLQNEKKLGLMAGKKLMKREQHTFCNILNKYNRFITKIHGRGKVNYSKLVSGSKATTFKQVNKMYGIAMQPPSNKLTTFIELKYSNSLPSLISFFGNN